MLTMFSALCNFQFKSVANLASKLRDSMHQSVKRIPETKNQHMFNKLKT